MSQAAIGPSDDDTRVRDRRGLFAGTGFFTCVLTAAGVAAAFCSVTATGPGDGFFCLDAGAGMVTATRDGFAVTLVAARPAGAGGAFFTGFRAGLFFARGFFRWGFAAALFEVAPPRFEAAFAEAFAFLTTFFTATEARRGTDFLTASNFAALPEILRDFSGFAVLFDAAVTLPAFEGDLPAVFLTDALPFDFNCLEGAEAVRRALAA